MSGEVIRLLDYDHRIAPFRRRAESAVVIVLPVITHRPAPSTRQLAQERRARARMRARKVVTTTIPITEGAAS